MPLCRHGCANFALTHATKRHSPVSRTKDPGVLYVKDILQIYLLKTLVWEYPGIGDSNLNDLQVKKDLRAHLNRI